jgi:hypothetical protein
MSVGCVLARACDGLRLAMGEVCNGIPNSVVLAIFTEVKGRRSTYPEFGTLVVGRAESSLGSALQSAYSASGC